MIGGLKMLKVKIKKLHENAVIPQYAKPGDAALDLMAVSIEYNTFTGQYTYDTGLAFEIPEGYVGLIFPRSSICKKNLQLSNSVGIGDSQYRGTIKAVFNSVGPFLANSDSIYKVGDRIAQIMILPYPQVQFEEVEELSTTERGIGGFGSTNN